MHTPANFVKYYQNIRKRTLALIAVIPPQHLHYSYAQGKFTIADILRHIGCIEWYMFAQTLQNQASQYTGCGKNFGTTLPEIQSHLAHTHQQTIDIINSLTQAQFEGHCHTPTGIPIARHKWLMLLAEHEIHHRAQLYIYLQMLGIATPAYIWAI